MSKMEIFRNEDIGEMRGMIINDEAWIVAKDIAKALGYVDEKKAINRHCKNATEFRELNKDLEQPLYIHPQTKFIPEGDIYRLIVASKLLTKEEKRKLIKSVTNHTIPIVSSSNEIEYISLLRVTLAAIDKDLEVIYQYKFSDSRNNYKADLFVPRFNTIIEFDENSHRGYNMGKEAVRERLMKKLGYKLIRINGDSNMGHNIGSTIKQLFDL